MKIIAILAALVLATPAASFGDPRGHGTARGGGRGPQHYSHRHYSHGYGGWGGYSPWWGYSPYGWYGPGPAVTFSYYNAPRVYRGEAYPSSVETAVQRALKHEGYYHGALDGEIGSQSRAAIREYQMDHGLDVTGRVDRSLLRSLDL